MPSPEHETYQEQLTDALRQLANDPDLRRRIDQLADVIAVFYHLDLEGAAQILGRCYAASPRGGNPWAPLALFRAVLLGHLIDQPRFPTLSRALRGCPVLRAIAGFSEEQQRSHTRPAPGASTFYDFCNRLLDGPRSPDRPIPPSTQNTRRASTPRHPQDRPDRADHNRDKKGVSTKTQRVSERLRQQLQKARHLDNPDDLNTRLGEILLSCAVLESARRGLFGDLSALTVSGDGSPLPTAANGRGRRACDCPKTTRCGCPRLFSDPDACWGYDSYRETYFFGHHFYELGVYRDGVDLPLHVRLDPGNETDHTASLKALEWLNKALRAHYPGMAISTFIADAGHDGMPVYQYCQEWSIDTVIPLSGPAPASHPSRAEVSLSPAGVPMCAAGVEMARWGTSGADRRLNFICPLRAKKIAQCPIAPESQLDWHCTGQKYGPTVTVASKTDPRLFPSIPRGSTRYKRLYSQRSGTERSNNVKKHGQGVLGCRHRRAHLWQIRLVGVAVLQHARAWVRDQDHHAFIAELLGEQEAIAA